MSAPAPAPPSPLRLDLEAIVRHLVDHPEAVRIEEFASPEERLFELTVDPEDLGKVIGRQGRTIRALRTLLEVRSASEPTPCSLEVIED